MSIRALEIAKFLGKEIVGPDRDILKPCSIENCIEGGLIFIKRYDEDLLSKLSQRRELTAIVTEDYCGKLPCTYIISANPRLDFARSVKAFFYPQESLPYIAKTAVIGKNVVLGEDVSIGEYSIIGDNVTIGDRTEIHHHVVINTGSHIGNDCCIKSNTIIGEEGFGFERDENGIPIRIPHLGRVIVGNNVEIGSLCSIGRGTLDNTIIGDNTKTDTHVHIGHNAIIGKSCIITACVEISGSARIGNNTWLGPNSSIMNGISIGNNCFIGLGTVVTKSLPDNVVAAGCPARIIRYND